MKYTILHILCEGQTEERFVKDVLGPYMQQFNIFVKPILLLTSKKHSAQGGIISYEQVVRDLGILHKRYQDNAAERHLFTTMVDYFALPHDFPGFREAERIQDVRLRIAFLEQKFSERLNWESFIPYLQLHEFEALMFVDIEKLNLDYPLSFQEIAKLRRETSGEDPEMINNHPDTAPSKRIISALSFHYHYNKVKSGVRVTSQIGMEALLANCTHFREWVEKVIFA